MVLSLSCCMLYCIQKVGRKYGHLSIFDKKKAAIIGVRSSLSSLCMGPFFFRCNANASWRNNTFAFCRSFR